MGNCCEQTPEEFFIDFSIVIKVEAKQFAKDIKVEAKVATKRNIKVAGTEV